jgi:hypothetical protein
METVVAALIVMVATALVANFRNPLSTRNIVALYGLFVSVRLVAVRQEQASWIDIVHPLWVASVFFIACVALRIGYLWAVRGVLSSDSVGRYQLPEASLLVVGIGCQIVGLIGWVGAVGSTGFGVLNIAALLSGDTRYLADTPLILDVAMNLAGAGVAILSLRIRDARTLLQTFALAAPSLLLAVALSRRSLFIPLLVFPCFVYWLRAGNVRFNRVLAAALVVLAVSTSLLAMRLYYGFGWEREEGGLQASLFSGFLMHFEEADPLIAVLDANRNLVTVDWARASWVAWTYELVPSAIAGHKPSRLVVPIQVAREYFGLADKRTGLPATIFATLLLTGGLPVLAVGALSIGAVMSRVDILVDRWRWDDWGLPVGVWLWMFVALYLFRLGDLSAAIGQVLVQSIGLIIVLTGMRLVYRRKVGWAPI